MPEPKILFVLTSSATMGLGGRPTGAWLEEFTIPYYALRDAGCEVDIVTTQGGAVPFDLRSTGRASTLIAANRRFYCDAKVQPLLQATPSVTRVDFEAYDAVFLPGGHGTMWDLPQSEALARGVGAIFGAGKPVAAVCHGPAGLLATVRADGKPLVEGHWVAAFTTDEEVESGEVAVVPFLLDQRLAALGACIVKGRPFVATAVCDGNLITGQNPQSAAATSALLMAALSRREKVPATSCDADAAPPAALRP